jgi:hypothetical protein
MQPTFLSHMCPFCAQEKALAQATERERVEIGPRPDTWRFDRVWQGGKSGSPKPGSFEESVALDRIDELREEAREKERRRRGNDGRVVTQRIEDGKVVSFISVRGRRGLVRAG